MNSRRPSPSLSLSELMLACARRFFESAKGGRQPEDEEAIDDTYNCSWCGTGVRHGDRVQRGHFAGAGRAQLRPDDQGCRRMRAGLVAWSRRPLPSVRDGAALPSGISYRPGGTALLAELIRARRD